MCLQIHICKKINNMQFYIFVQVDVIRHVLCFIFYSFLKTAVCVCVAIFFLSSSVS